MRKEFFRTLHLAYLMNSLQLPQFLTFCLPLPLSTPVVWDAETGSERVVASQQKENKLEIEEKSKHFLPDISLSSEHQCEK